MIDLNSVVRIALLCRSFGREERRRRETEKRDGEERRRRETEKREAER